MKIFTLFSFFLLFLLTTFYPTEAIEGFYKDVFQDEGTQISGADLEIDCEYIEFTQEHLNTTDDVSGQAEIMIQNPNDENGYLLYPDGEPRFAIIYYHGGYMGHAADLGAEGKQRIRDHYYHGGSQFGSSAGSYMLSSMQSTYFEIWPGTMNGNNVSSEAVDKIINAGSPFIGYLGYTAGSTITGVYHNNGCSIDTTDMPAGTKICAMHNSGDLTGYGAVWSWKDNDTTGRVLGHTGHPEGNTAEEKKKYIGASMLYLRDGLGIPDIKGQLYYDVERVMNKSTSDNDPLFTKIGDKQYHHFIIIFARPTNHVKITLDGEDGYDFHLFAAKDTFAFNHSADYVNSTSGSDKVLAIGEAVPACTLFVGVKLDTTVDTASGSIFPVYTGALEVLNGLAYSIKYDTINTTDTMTVVSPNGGEQWERGTVKNISWNTSLTGNVKIDLLKNNILHSTIAASVSSTGPYPWTIPDTLSYGTDYRVRISSINYPNVNDESDGNFTIYKSPSVTSSFLEDTVIATGKPISLTGSATGAPIPTYEWFFIHPVSQDPVSKGNGATLSLTSADKADSGHFYFVADNGYDSVSSDTIFIHVLTPVSIVVDLATTQTIVNGGEAFFSIDAAGDDTIHYQWYENGILMSGETGSSLSIDTVDSAIHDGKKYLCKVLNTFLGTTVGRDSSTECQITVSNLYNPFKVKAERYSATQVRMKLWSDITISDFPSTQSSEPWADSVWVMYQTNEYAADTLGVPFKRYSIDNIKQAAVTNDSLKEILTVGALQGDHDSCYWFNYTVLWHVPGEPDELLKPFTNGNKVVMFDTTASQNPLSVSGKYFDKTDSVRMVIESINLLNSTTDSMAIFQCSRYPTYTPLLFDSSISVPVLLTAGSKDTLIVHNLGPLPIETDTAYFRWYILGKNEIASVKKTSKTIIGWDRPVYSGQLHADTTERSDQAQLSWDSPAQGADSIRIWWDTQKIPLTHDITLPAGQAFYVSTSAVIDTLSNLNPETMYYFGLQTFKDMMWSSVTVLSSDSVMTLKADSSLIIPNQITIDTSWFDTSSNVINIGCSIDTIGITTDSTYLQCGYSYSIDPDAFKTIQPSQWKNVAGITAVSSIALGSNIVFDTTYHAGMWLRKCKIIGGVGLAAGPGDTVKTTVRTPAYLTWQEITLSSDKPDTVYAMNGRIIIISITPFDFSDTLRGYIRQVALPEGTVDLGGTGFRFSKPNLQIPDFKIGMKHNPVRSLITNNNKNIYKDSAGPLNVIYGSEAEDSVVWAIISGTDMAYPFLVLADTVKPTISFTGTITDTAKILDPDSSVTTQFSISDNISNVKWQFSYGAGNMGYAYGTEGYLDTCMKILTTVIPTSDNVVSPAFGLRAIVIVNDGVYTDTVNVSRRVNVSNSDATTAPSMEWVPLRATSTLADSTIQTVLSNFVNEQGAWEYDRTKFLAAQWYDTTAGLGCEVIEYSDALHDDFSFIPGRVIWLKSAETQAINFGPGVTTSLKEMYTIILQGYCWSDFSLPYKFPVKLKNILAATGIRGDSLVFYHWVKSDSTYVAAATYIPALDSASGKLDTITIRYSPLNDAYTVYSYSSAPMALKIPPIPPALSPGSGTLTESAQKRQDIWDISLLWKKENSSFINKVRCGYNGNGTGKTLIGPLPPSFGKIGAGVSDGNGRIGGYAVHNKIDKGGLNYEIVLYNQSRKNETIEYCLDRIENLPDGYITRIYNPVTTEFEKDKTSVTLKANSSERRWVVIGTENYLNGFLENNIVSSFALLGTYPNPFRGRFNIQYMVPWQGVKKIKFRIFDLRGCTVWEEDISKGVRPGINTIAWNTNGKNGKRIASGIYLLRMTVYENGKKGYKVFQRKLTCLK